MNTFSLKDKVMVITGGTNGIGKGLVEYFVDRELCNKIEIVLFNRSGYNIYNDVSSEDVFKK